MVNFVLEDDGGEAADGVADCHKIGAGSQNGRGIMAWNSSVFNNNLGLNVKSRLICILQLPAQSRRSEPFGCSSRSLL